MFTTLKKICKSKINLTKNEPTIFDEKKQKKNLSGGPESEFWSQQKTNRSFQLSSEDKIKMSKTKRFLQKVYSNKKLG